MLFTNIYIYSKKKIKREKAHLCVILYDLHLFDSGTAARPQSVAVGKVSRNG